ncbi:disease resistance protein PIK6-NP-like [Panicum virgatum]|uniref:Rx N-terminal domain-containing protein n=1 Tax=Panicum virgatum TaxID=38727 RepID=A0A8T0PMW7_PANVG|nr:disease resistance protein PIK6-NP-like [Panicum virgatum]KAG2562445.1 hypothetical protein PVAP13_8KG106900 [Panicum virgatum]
MADTAFSVVSNLLGFLKTAITDEAKLLGGVHGDVQFIKDEMDSMNGFLLHLTKTEGEHDDQLRAWMKQVLEVAHIARDYIERYKRDVPPPPKDDGDRPCCWAWLRDHLDALPTARNRKQRDLAKKLLELKVRVKEVGERRLRYDVKVPAAPPVLRQAVKPPGQGEMEEEASRKAFRDALEDDIIKGRRASSALLVLWRSGPPGSEPAVSNAIPKLADCLRSEGGMIRAILKKCCAAPDDVELLKMFLCALWAYPYPTSKELGNLKNKLDGGGREPREEMRIFCYSMLSSQQKSCLQYLTAFTKEKEISRTSLVRRWAAEGLVAKDHDKTPEEVGERCFNELVFRGFVLPVRRGDDATTVRSCQLDGSIRDFILGMTQSENFLAELPSHLQRQLQIREIVLQPRPPPEQIQADGWCNNIVGRRRAAAAGLLSCCCGTSGGDTATSELLKDPMDELVLFLKTKLPEMYRLNVLDLGGCKGLKKRHLESICRSRTVGLLKYLSLRNTDVSQLPEARHMKKLEHLETLDIRGTDVPAGDLKDLILPKLKHLLAGRYSFTAGGADAGTSRTLAEVSISTVQMPRAVGAMADVETLSRFQVSGDGAELEEVVKLLRLRKLGVVVVRGNSTTAKHLCHVMSRLGEHLRSLSIWVEDDGSGRALDISVQVQATSFQASRLALENLDIKGTKISVPSWIQEASLLANITLHEATEMTEEDLRRLGNAPGLRCLRLRRSSFGSRVLRFRSGQFRALRFLVLEGEAITSVAFVDGAAPVLERITVWASGSFNYDDLIAGVISSQLPGLKAIELKGNDFNQKKLDTWQKDLKKHKNRPSLVV